MAMISLCVIVLIILLTIFANVVSPYSFDEQDQPIAFQYPSIKHLMGTDNFGRDILTRVARLSAPSSAASLAQQQVTLAMLMITLPCV